MGVTISPIAAKIIREAGTVCIIYSCSLCHLRKIIRYCALNGAQSYRKDSVNMAGQIRITPDQMRSRAGEYRAQANTVQEVISKMDTLLNTLQGEWEGQASQAYAQRFSELRPGFVKAEDLINEIAQSLDAAAQTLETSDQNVATGFRA